MFSSRLCVILILAINLVNALPVSHTSGLERRGKDPVVSNDPKDWPSKEKLDKTMQTGPHQAEFWAGRTDGVSAQKSAEEHAKEHGGTTLEAKLHDEGHKMPGWKPEDPAVEAKWTEASEAFAHGAKGDVNAHLGKEIRPNSVYTNQEKPILEQNPDVHSITEHAHGQPGVRPQRKLTDAGICKEFCDFKEANKKIKRELY
jgi:hypothetical protein